jgi:bacterial/archaeal transporter family-2 protein
VTTTRPDGPSDTVPDRTTAGAAAYRAFGAALAFLGGVSLAVQSRMNGQLAGQIGDGVVTALISFGGGLLLLVLGVSAVPAGRRGLRRLGAALRAGTLRPWQMLGGVCGAYLVATQGLTVGLLGVAAFTVALVAGQVVSGLVVDRLGLGPSGPQPVTARRVAGAVLAVAAVVLSVAEGLGVGGGLWLAVLPALAGVGTAWQQAVNGRVRGAADNAFVAGLVNFSVGTAALLLAAAVELPLRGRPPAFSGPWWLYLGGALGIVVIVTAAAAVRYVGVLLVGLCSVAGLLVGAVLLDLLVPAPGHHLAATTLVGAVIILLAVVVAALPARPRR